jgi:hypothetical protein
LLVEEPLATRMKQCLGQVGGSVQLPQMHQMHQVHQMHQMHQVPQVSQIPHILHIPQMNQLPQTFPVNTVGYSGQSVIPVEWNQELGVCTRPAVVFSEPMQAGSFVPQDTAMTESEWGTRPIAAQETDPILDTKVVKAENDLTTSLGNTVAAVFEAQVTTVKPESGILQQVPLATDTAKNSQVSNIVPKEEKSFVFKEHTESPATTGLKETESVTEVHVPSVSTSEGFSVQPQFSASLKEELTASQGDQATVPITENTTTTSVSGAPQDAVAPLTLANGELQAEILRAMNVGVKSVSSEAA